MSVPTGRRRESDLTFVDAARALCDDVVKFHDHLPRAYRETYGWQMVDKAIECVALMKSIYDIYIEDDESYRHKKMLCDQATDGYEYINTRLDILMNTYTKKQRYINQMVKRITNIVSRIEGLQRVNDKQYAKRVIFAKQKSEGVDTPTEQKKKRRSPALRSNNIGNVKQDAAQVML